MKQRARAEMQRRAQIMLSRNRAAVLRSHNRTSEAQAISGRGHDARKEQRARANELRSRPKAKGVVKSNARPSAADASSGARAMQRIMRQNAVITHAVTELKAELGRERDHREHLSRQLEQYRVMHNAMKAEIDQFAMDGEDEE